MKLLQTRFLAEVCGALMMTPETANGRGSVPLLGEMEDATGVDLVPGQSWLFGMAFR